MKRRLGVLLLYFCFLFFHGCRFVQGLQSPEIRCKGDLCEAVPENTETGKGWRAATLSIHADEGIESSPDVAPPIHVTTTYITDNTEGLVYSRDDTATRRRAEKVLGELEGGHAVLYSSGLAATVSIFLHVHPKVVILPKGYHGTHLVLDMYRKLAEDVKVMDLEEWEASGANGLGKGDLIWLETPTNPKCNIYDIKKYADLAHSAGAFLAVDSTFASPILQTPLDYGADFVFHSCTKYLGGHSDVLMGGVVVKDEETAKKLRFQRLVQGNVPGSLETFLLLRSLRTLSLRVSKQAENAKIVAQYLSTHEKVSVVYHPSISTHMGYELAKVQMKAPHSPPCFSVELKSEEAAKKFTKNLKLFVEATSLGGVESMIDWRYRYDKSLSPALLRLSIGIEDPEDLIEDIKQALATV